MKNYKIHSECEFPANFHGITLANYLSKFQNVAVMGFGDDLGKQVLLMKCLLY